jgi:flagellar P-ring protein precursor FlgI
MLKIMDWTWISVLAALMVFASNKAKGQSIDRDPAAQASSVSKIKDLVKIRGVRTNQLMGVGIVMGLNNTGDSVRSLTTNKAVSALLTKLGYKTSDQEIVSGSAASVMVLVDMPTFSRAGDKLDARVSIVGDAKSLASGYLISTPLRAADGGVYGFAQGPIAVGQANGEGVRVLTSATVSSGATVEKEFVPVIDSEGKISLTLVQPDFTHNRRVVETINQHFKGFYAKSIDLSAIDVEIPPHYDGRLVDFLSEIENLLVEIEPKNLVVINERTGTVVMGSQVVITPVTIAHGDLSIVVGDSNGKGAKNSPSKSILNMGGSTVGKLMEAMNAMGMKPSDLVGVMQALKAAGALQAEIKFM